MEKIHNDFILHATTIEQASILLNSNTEQGLTIEKAKTRLVQFGLNAIEDAKAISPFKILVSQFKSPIVFLLLFAAAMSFWFKEWLDGIAFY